MSRTVPAPPARPAIPLPEPARVVEPANDWTVREGMMCLDSRNFENHMRNDAEAVRWIMDARDQIDYYREDR